MLNAHGQRDQAGQSPRPELLPVFTLQARELGGLGGDTDDPEGHRWLSQPHPE